MPTKTIAQLTLNPSPTGTNLLETDDGLGHSWKNTFSQLHDTTFPPYLIVTYTGTLPISFPYFQIAEGVGFVNVTTSGNNPITKYSGVSTFTPFLSTDALGLLTTLEFTNLVAFAGSYATSSSGSVACAPTSMPGLTSLSFPELVSCAGNFAPTTMAILTTLNLPLLNDVTGIFGPTTMAALTTLSAPALKWVGQNFGPTTMAALTTFNFPSLVYVEGGFQPGTMASLTTISMPALKKIGSSITISGMASLTTVSMPAVEVYGAGITMTTGLGSLSSVTLGTPGTLKLFASSSSTINISGQALNAATVNGILALLVSLDGTNGTTLWGAGKTVNLSGGTSAAPSGQGIVDKATLVARTATVTTN